MSHDEDSPPYLDPVVQLLIEYRRVAEALWTELRRHEVEHGCGGRGPRCELDATLTRAWVDTVRMADALDFVVLGETPHMYRRSGYAIYGSDWFSEYLPGPWHNEVSP